MKKLKIAIIFLIILLILVIGILIYLNSSDIYKNDLIVSPVEENDEFTSEEKFDAVSQSLTKQIQYKNINSFHLTNVTDEQMAKKYYSDYKYNMMYNPMLAYELLDSEYREKKFGTYENFLQYVNDMSGYIMGESFSNYKIEKSDGSTIYTCEGNNNRKNYYRETSVMQYTVILDDYTIITDEQKETYNNWSNEQKVMYNISKFVTMIEQKDYRQAYMLLDENFRNTRFPTMESFRDYIKDKFYDINTILSAQSGEIENGYTKYTIQIVETNSETGLYEQETITKDIYIKLDEEMEFSLMFDEL